MIDLEERKTHQFDDLNEAFDQDKQTSLGISRFGRWVLGVDYLLMILILPVFQPALNPLNSGLGDWIFFLLILPVWLLFLSIFPYKLFPIFGVALGLVLIRFGWVRRDVALSRFGYVFLALVWFIFHCLMARQFHEWAY
ncbi:MAG: hypothetical protein KC931_03275 [Candidatus Omnitrophica bacterium]|nr:hypothetical protein [Candidatus Omnitrophota bacterium]MCA9446111.1 hypothetical protein [Candidatus Omnitrophota bacterium]